MFITNERYDEILKMINEKGVLEVIPKLSQEEAQAFLEIYHGDAPKDEHDRMVIDGYKSGIFDQDDDPYLLWD